MTVVIAPLGAAIFALSIFVGCLVYRHTRTAPAGKGDIVGAIAASATVLTALVLLLGGSTDSLRTSVDQPEAPPSTNAPSYLDHK